MPFTARRHSVQAAKEDKLQRRRIFQAADLKARGKQIFSSSGPLLFNLRRDSLLQLWIFSRASLSVCHQLLSSCLYCPRASSLICQEPLFSSSGPLLFNLPRDYLLQLWTFSSLPSAFLQLLKLSQGLSSNLPGASLQQLRTTSV